MPFNVWDLVVVALIILMVIGAVKLYKRPRSCCSGRGGDGCSGCAGCTVRRDGENASSPKS